MEIFFVLLQQTSLLPLLRSSQARVSLSLTARLCPPCCTIQQNIESQIFSSNFEAFKAWLSPALPSDLSRERAKLIMITPGVEYQGDMREKFENKLVTSVGAVSLCYTTASRREAPSRPELQLQFLSLFRIFPIPSPPYFSPPGSSASFHNRTLGLH